MSEQNEQNEERLEEMRKLARNRGKLPEGVSNPWVSGTDKENALKEAYWNELEEAEATGNPWLIQTVQLTEHRRRAEYNKAVMGMGSRWRG